MREIHSSLPSALSLGIRATDEPGQGGACHRYEIYELRSQDSNPSRQDGDTVGTHQVVLFQNGPVFEAGTNGVTNEALLAIVADRLAGFNAGPFACRENAIALTKIQEALMWLNRRTGDRIMRGVEGKNEK